MKMGDGSDEKREPQKVGVGAFLWPLALVAFGIYNLSRPVPSHTYGWIMIVVGGVFAMLGLIAWRFGSPSRGAKKVDDLYQQVYSGVHEKRVVDESTIRAYRLDESFYGVTTEALERLGFHRLKDVVDVDSERTWLRARAVIRTFLSKDGTTMGGIYHLRFGGWVGLLSLIRVLPRNLKTTDLETELTDGTFVTTSDARLAGMTSEFPGISRAFLPPGGATAALWEAHVAHVRRELSDREPGVTAKVLRTYDDLSASQDRLQLLKCRHRNSPEFDMTTEIALALRTPLTPEQQAMADEAERLHRERVQRDDRSNLAG
jgi:hypothetical protein